MPLNRLYEIIPSTRTSPDDKDGHRDFDGFDVDEELKRARNAVAAAVNSANGRALQAKLFHIEALRAACAMFDNIDEWLSRGGAIPSKWQNHAPSKEHERAASKWMKAKEERTKKRYAKSSKRKAKK